MLQQFRFLASHGKQSHPMITERASARDTEQAFSIWNYRIAHPRLALAYPNQAEAGA
jgi:hypothetical protein